MANLYQMKNQRIICKSEYKYFRTIKSFRQPMKKTVKRIMITTLIIIAVLTAATTIFLQFPQFGKLPSGARLEKIKNSPHYHEGAFQNLNETPTLTKGVSYYSVLKEFIFGDKPRVAPIDVIPSIKTNLFKLDPKQDVMIWFGHSSYFIQIDGKKILVDPVFSGAASPVSFLVKAFKGTDAYQVDDLPEIDYLCISHDHYDHIDYETLLKLKPKVKKVICGLGNGEHFEYWGYDKNIIFEKDWFEEIKLDSGFTVYTVPARHFSGRGLQRNQTLWTSFAFLAPTMKIYIGGDSGYDTHYSEARNKFGNFDLVILENGQYDKNWKYIHHMPEEVIQAAKDLGAKQLFPVHSSKFVLANHPWDEPLIRITELGKNTDLHMITPIIGEQINLKDLNQKFSHWWEGLR